MTEWLTLVVVGGGSSKIGQSRIHAPYMTVHLVIPPPEIPYMHRIYMVLANPTRYQQVVVTGDGVVLITIRRCDTHS